MWLERCDRTEDYSFILSGQNENEMLVWFWKPMAVMSLVIQFHFPILLFVRDS